MSSALKKDFSRYYKIDLSDDDPSFMKKVRLVLALPGLQAIIVYRLGQWIFHSGMQGNILMLIRYLLRPLYYLINGFVIKMFGIDISRKAKIGAGLYIGHFSGIKINNVLVGENVSIHQHVKICSEVSCQNHQVENAYIGDNVWVGPHCFIGCGIHITDGATIAAGSVVKNDIDTPSLVSGNPARVTLKYYDNAELL